MRGLKGTLGWERQRGMTLMELLVAAIVSLIATSAMVIIMGNTLGTGTLTIQMSQLSKEMRNGMQIITRELRRANFHSTYMACYGNPDCTTDLGITTQVGDIHITDNGTSDCFWFWYDRPQTGTQTAITAEPVAAFRRDTNTDGIGTVQMTTTSTGAPNCNVDTGWTDITDPNVIDVLTFNIDDNVTGFASYSDTINSAGATQSVERIEVSLTARLVADASVPAWLQGNANATRTLQDFILVRNHTTAPAP